MHPEINRLPWNLRTIKQMKKKIRKSIMSKFQDLSETQSKLILDRICCTEKNTNAVIQCIEGLLKKESKFINKTDEFANKLKVISDSEIYDESLGNIFEHMSIAVVHLADINSLKISRIEEKFLNDLMQYDNMICKNAREEAKSLIALRDFEINRRSQLNMNKKQKKNILAENEVMLSNIQISKLLKELTTNAEKFDNQKFKDFKSIMLNFLLIHLKYFTSGIEILTTAYENINESSHSEQFIKELKTVNKQFKKQIEHDNSQVHRFPFMRALSRFSHSTSNVDLIGKDDTLFKKRTVKKAQSTMSLNSIDSTGSEIVKRGYPIDLSKIEKASDSEDSDIDESSNMEPTDTETTQNKQ